MNENTTETTIKTDWPLWKVALRKLRDLPEYGYGLKLPVSWFEQAFTARRDTSDFAFQMMELRAEVESSDGYYLHAQTVQEDDTGNKAEFYQIPSAADHQGVAVGFEGKMRRFAARSLKIRVKTLENPKAQLTDCDRRKMEKSSEIAATRIVLLRREKAIANTLKKHAPKLLAN